jgi:hypothetical protein
MRAIERRAALRRQRNERNGRLPVRAQQQRVRRERRARSVRIGEREKAAAVGSAHANGFRFGVCALK